MKNFLFWQSLLNGLLYLYGKLLNTIVMNKKIQTLVLAILVLLPLKLIFAQNSWAPVGTQWYYTVKDAISINVMVKYEYQLLEVVDDTVINGQNCRKMQRINKLNICDEMSNDCEFLYENDNKIFWYNRALNKFTKLHDFNANVGDTWEIEVDTCSFYVSVTNVEYEEFFGKTRKVLHINDAMGYFSGKIVEGIGSLNHFFPTDIFYVCKGTFCCSPVVTDLRCFIEDSEFQYKKDDFPCDTIYVDKDLSVYKIDKNNLSVYPNPVSNFIYIKNNTDENISTLGYLIYDIQGKVIREGETNGNSIFVGDLRKGVYRFSVFSKDKKYYKSVKFIKL